MLELEPKLVQQLQTFALEILSVLELECVQQLYAAEIQRVLEQERVLQL